MKLRIIAPALLVLILLVGFISKAGANPYTRTHYKHGGYHWHCPVLYSKDLGGTHRRSAYYNRRCYVANFHYFRSYDRWRSQRGFFHNWNSEENCVHKRNYEPKGGPGYFRGGGYE